jgi:hypothetical protein
LQAKEFALSRNRFGLQTEEVALSCNGGAFEVLDKGQEPALQLEGLEELFERN